jgi:hypothetical protein
VGNDAHQRPSHPGHPPAHHQVTTICTHLNAVKDGGVEHVDTGVDAVADELDGLLNEAVNDCRAGLGDDDTVCRGLGNLGNLKRVRLGANERGADSSLRREARQNAP